MNLKEGLRRTGLVLGCGVFLIVGTSTFMSDQPSPAMYDYDYKSKLMQSTYNEQSAEFKRTTSLYDMEEGVWPRATDLEIIKSACSKNLNLERAALCEQRVSKINSIWFEWLKHVFLTIGFAFGASLFTGLLWWAFSWVVLGFTQPKEAPPKS